MENTRVEFLHSPPYTHKYDLVLSLFYFKLGSTLGDMSLLGFVCLFFTDE